VAPISGSGRRSAEPPNWPKLNTGAAEEATPWRSTTKSRDDSS
jgi:hypothetical protein